MRSVGSDRPPIRDVLRIIYIRGARGARQVALVLECGHWITRRRPPVHLANGLACVGCVIDKVLREDAAEAQKPAVREAVGRVCEGTIEIAPSNAQCLACGLYGQRCERTGRHRGAIEKAEPTEGAEKP